MNQYNFPYPEEVFPGVVYSNNGNKAFGPESDKKNVVYNETLRDAGSFIERFKVNSSEIPFDSNKYNFSLFQANDLTNICSMHQGYIRFLTKTVNDILDLPPNTQISTLPRFKNKQKIDHELGLLGTQIYPDTEYMISLNYEDFPVGFLGFDILEDGSIEIVQLQSGRIVDETNTFFSQKQHYLDGFEWTKVLIKFLEDYFKSQGFTGNIIIQSAENNGKYTHPENLSTNQEVREKQEKRNQGLLKHYNSTAMMLGYQRGAKNWDPKKSGYLDYSRVI